MSNTIAVSVNSISKTYKLYQSKKYRILELVHPFRKGYHKKFHALSNISFQVEKGDALGIIGKNGSGKSTLLKILASVATPTSGSFTCNGKVTALLELGGGFNKELTGVENIYYIGALQGYSRKEMSARLDKILDFADIGDYAYQPVNSYSSGMYVRLAFSMSINIDPDILITDEALAVGDLRFQQKCFRKIREFRESGKTIIICTHSLSAVRDFCNHAIWIHNGKIREQGDPVYVTDCYNSFMTSKEPEKHSHESQKILFPSFEKTFLPVMNSLSTTWDDLSKCESYGNLNAEILYASFVNADTNQAVGFCSGGEMLRIYLCILFKTDIINPDIQIVVNGPYGSPVCKFSNMVYKKPIFFNPKEPGVVAIDFKLPNLGNGRYTLSAGIVSMSDESKSHLHWVHDAFIFEISNPDIRFKTGAQLVIENIDFNRLA